MVFKRCLSLKFSLMCILWVGWGMILECTPLCVWVILLCGGTMNIRCKGCRLDANDSGQGILVCSCKVRNFFTMWVPTFKEDCAQSDLVVMNILCKLLFDTHIQSHNQNYDITKYYVQWSNTINSMSVGKFNKRVLNVCFYHQQKKYTDPKLTHKWS